MTLNLLFTIVFFGSLGVFCLSAVVFAVTEDDYVSGICFISIILFVVSLAGVATTPVRVKSETYSIIKITNKHYMIKKGNVVEIHKLPDRYHLTSKKSYVKTDKAADFYIFADNEDQLGKFTVYLNDKR